jgi:hypothetical protein
MRLETGAPVGASVAGRIVAGAEVEGAVGAEAVFGAGAALAGAAGVEAVDGTEVEDVPEHPAVIRTRPARTAEPRNVRDIAVNPPLLSKSP